jgi:hypothetical protein
MLEGLLLLLLSIGGHNGAPAAAVESATSPAAITGVWRGTWQAPEGADRVPIEAVVQSVTGDGRISAWLVRGEGASKRTLRLLGKLGQDGARFEVPGGGALRLSAFSASRLVGDIRGIRAGGPFPGDGLLDLARVRR